MSKDLEKEIDIEKFKSAATYIIGPFDPNTGKPVNLKDLKKSKNEK